MAREIPEVVRAAAGLAATVLDEARKLPETLPGLPVRVIGMAMQHAMKVQQQYAELVARGDELFTGLRGENEPGLATFDDDVEPVTVTQPTNGYRESAFDRTADTFAADETATDDEVATLPADPPADAVTAAVDDLADRVETGQQSIEELVDEAPAIQEILDEIAVDELVEQAPDLDETALGTPAVEDAPATEDATAVGTALLESDDAPAAAGETADVSATVDVITPDGEIAAVEASVTDEGIAAPEAPAAEEPSAETPAPPAPAKPRKAAKTTSGKGGKSKKGATATEAAAGDTAATDTAASDTNAGPATTTEASPAEDSAIAESAAVGAVGETSTAPTDDPQGASELAGSQAVGAAPVDGYDSFSVAQLRGRLRGYALSTVQDLLAYEEATRAREQYVRLLRNRLEKLEQQAVESSPLAPRGV